MGECHETICARDISCLHANGWWCCGFIIGRLGKSARTGTDCFPLQTGSRF